MGVNIRGAEERDLLTVVQLAEKLVFKVESKIIY